MGMRLCSANYSLTMIPDEHLIPCSMLVAMGTLWKDNSLSGFVLKQQFKEILCIATPCWHFNWKLTPPLCCRSEGGVRQSANESWISTFVVVGWTTLNNDTWISIPCRYSPSAKGGRPTVENRFSSHVLLGRHIHTTLLCSLPCVLN